jgi:thiamine-monophosphate kinase
LNRKVAKTVAKPSSEFQRIARIGTILDQGRGPKIKLGIGDDAAIIRFGKESLVWTTDSSVEEVHFRRELMSFGDVGWRSFNAAVSDVAAMGASPIAALSAIELPRSLCDRELYELVEGQSAASKALKCPVAGGNLASAAKVSVTTSVLGHATAPLLRSTAKPGDELWLIGSVGLAAAGLACLTRSGSALRGSDSDYCVSAFRRPVARVTEGKRLQGRAHAAIDVSDGLAGDLGHIAESSKVAVLVDERALAGTLAPELLKVADKLGRPAMKLALYGGEDYALLASGPSQKRPRFAEVIGEVTEGMGVWFIALSGRRRRLGGAFDHFSRHA